MISNELELLIRQHGKMKMNFCKKRSYPQRKVASWIEFTKKINEFEFEQ